MINSHPEKTGEVGGEPWQPVLPPKRGEDRTAFHAFVLLPGLSISFYAAILHRSRSSVSSYRVEALAAAQRDPAIISAVNEVVCAIRPEDGLQMAQLRVTAQLPHWSRVAIREYRKRGLSHREIATAFRCSPATVTNILHGKGTAYAVLSGERQLTTAQRRPPGRWKPAH